MNLSVLESLVTQPWSAGLLPLVKITAVLLAALAITVAMRRASAGARHLVWLVALASLLVLPFLAAWAPVGIPVLPGPTPAPEVAAPLQAPGSRDGIQTDAGVPPPTTPEASAPARPRPIDIVAVLTGIWLLGTAVLLARLVLSAWTVRRMVRRARPLEQPEWRQPLFEISDRLGLNEAPEIVQSERVKLPFATGFLRARIVLPAESESWSRDRRTAVLIHELGHVRRRDLVGHTLSRIVCALYWFHPLVWSGARRLRIESERACDDLALLLGERPSEYAEHLLDIVTQVRDHGAPAVALAMANPNEFEGRMLAILDPRVHRRGVGRLQAVGLAGSLAGLAALFGVISPAPKAVAKPTASMATGQPVSALVSRVDSSSRETSRDRTAHLVDSPEKPDPTGFRATEVSPKGDGARAPEDLARTPEKDARETSEDGRSGTEEKASIRIEILSNTLRSDESAETRRVAAWGLARYARNDLAARELAEALISDRDETVREMAAWALSGSRRTPSAVTALYAAFRRDKNADVRRTAAWAAGEIGDPMVVPGLVDLLSDRDAGVREIAAWSIGCCGGRRAPAALVRLLSDPEPQVRLTAAWALYEIQDPSGVSELESAFRREDDPEVRMGIIRALGVMGEGAVESLSKLVDSPDPKIRKIAITALAGGDATGPWPWPRPEPRPFP